MESHRHGETLDRLATPTDSRPPHLFLRALAAFLVFPATVAGLVPWLLRPAEAPFNALGLPLLGLGVVLLLWCVRDFYVAGRGTLAPWSPPERLVIVGLYRRSRNPMYLAVLTILIGWAVAFGSPTLWTYAGIMAIVFQLRVVRFEEPWLARTHGEQWAAYRSRVPRWLV